MAKPEKLVLASTLTDENSADNRLYEASYTEGATRVGDNGIIQVLQGTAGGTGTGIERPQVLPSGSWRAKPIHPVDLWPTTAASLSPTGPNGIQWNGNRPDVSRGPGGTVFQPRPDFLGNDKPLGPQPGPGVAPIAIEATRDPTGRPIGPVIFPPANVGVGDRGNVPADPGRAGGLIDRDGDGKLEDERSWSDKAIEQMRLFTFIGGLLIGLRMGRFKGAAVGGVMGLIAPEILKPLNPFK